MVTVTDDEVQGLSTMDYDARIRGLINATEPLLGLYGEICMVMEDPEWDKNLREGMGRIRRAWEECTEELGG